MGVAYIYTYREDGIFRASRNQECFFDRLPAVLFDSVADSKGIKYGIKASSTESRASTDRIRAGTRHHGAPTGDTGPPSARPTSRTSRPTDPRRH